MNSRLRNVRIRLEDKCESDTQKFIIKMMLKITKLMPTD